MSCRERKSERMGEMWQVAPESRMKGREEVTESLRRVKDTVKAVEEEEEMGRESELSEKATETWYL